MYIFLHILGPLVVWYCVHQANILCCNSGGNPHTAASSSLRLHGRPPMVQDKRVTFEEWGAIKGSTPTPFGQLPCLEVDGKYLAQSAAIGEQQISSWRPYCSSHSVAAATAVS